jgi:hypothetical protein
MTLTHLSHFGLEKLAETSTNVVFSGSLAACKRLAFAHGMEVESYEGRCLGMAGGRATVAAADATNFSAVWFKGGGLVLKGRDNYTLVMPLEVWRND